MSEQGEWNEYGEVVSGVSNVQSKRRVCNVRSKSS